MSCSKPSREATDYDVVIKGCRPAGLSAAIRFKQVDPDLTVVLLEKAPRSVPIGAAAPESWREGGR
jgi:flavin-dependent dehydrogenase